jgi:hypothetical protein
VAVYFSLLLSNRENIVGEKTDVWQGTLALMVLRTLETLGPLHGYGLAQRIEQTSGDLLQLSYGTLSGAAQTRARGLDPLSLGRL